MRMRGRMTNAFAKKRGKPLALRNFRSFKVRHKNHSGSSFLLPPHHFHKTNMAKVFIGIALAIILATAALSFLAKGNIDKLQSSLKGAKSSQEAAERKAKEEGQKAKAAEEERAAAIVKAEEATKQLTAKNDEISALSAQLTEQKNFVEAKTREVAELTANRPATTTTTTAVEDPRVPELTAQLQKAQAEAAEGKQLAESLNGQIRDMQTKLSAAEQKERLRAAGSVRAGLQGRILAVNPGWNFVVLSVGDKQGVIVNAPLIVIRGNEPVARLRVTSVEPSTSIADVIPGSVRRGVSVQPGDTVIFEGRASGDQRAAGVEPKLP